MDRTRGESTLPFPTLDSYFETLDERFRSEATIGIFGVVQFDLRGVGGYEIYIILDDGTMSVDKGRHDAASVTITMQAEDFLALINGRLDGPLAFAMGQGQITGDLMLAISLQRVFPLESVEL
ncbi:MAG: SCP2 sterol-binding domain-containing protein [Myxococcales bacterium]|nr:SCP2 sterol-binding domain-containing protein [Myxococcales bacterium]